MTALLEAARKVHIEQFAGFIEEMAAAYTKGAAEVKMELSEGSQCLERFYCADFMCNDGTAGIREMIPEDVLNLRDERLLLNGIELLVDDLVWDDVMLAHDSGTIDRERFEPWFLRWCDPDDVRPRPDGPFSLAAHSMILSPGEIWTDLGTATPDALIGLLDILRGAGARQVTVSASRAA